MATQSHTDAGDEEDGIAMQTKVVLETGESRKITVYDNGHVSIETFEDGWVDIGIDTNRNLCVEQITHGDGGGYAYQEVPMESLAETIRSSNYSDE